MPRLGSTRRSGGNKKIHLRTRRGTKHKTHGGGDQLLFKVFGLLVGASLLAFMYRNDHLSGDNNNLSLEFIQKDLKSRFLNTSQQILQGSGSAQHSTDSQPGATSNVGQGVANKDIQRLGAPNQDSNNNNIPQLRHNTNLDGPAHLLDLSQLAAEDFLSTSWLASKEAFLTWNLEAIQVPDHAYTFRAFGDESKLRMPMNYLDWGVEHYKRYFEVSRIWSKMNPAPFEFLSKRFNAYMERGMSLPDMPEPYVFQETIAVIPFEHFRTNADLTTADRMHLLTVTTLATCIEALRRAGFGRVVVVGLADDDESTVQQSFAHLAMALSPELKQQQQGKTFATRKIGHMEVAFVRGSEEHARTQQDPKNIPRAALMGLKEAFKLAGQTDSRTAWLGSATNNDWKYVYITEPDCILNVRPQAFLKLRAAVEAGLVLIPHRLQPIPFQRDVEGMNPLLYVPAEDEFQHPIQLDTNSADVCCDEVRGHNYRPGVNDFPDCHTFWWICGLNPSGQLHDKSRNIRLKAYGLIQLTQGTGVTLIAGTSHGRRCIPKKNSICDLSPPTRR